MKSIRRILFSASLVPALAVAGCDRHPHDPEDHSLGRVEIIDRGQTERPVVAVWTPDDGWTGELPAISLSSERKRISLGAAIYSRDGDPRALSREGEYSVRWSLAQGGATGIVATDDAPGDRFHGDHIHIYGLSAGTTQIEFLLWHGDHSDGATAPIAIRVVD
jgi:hypothetical protein